MHQHVISFCFSLCVCVCSWIHCFLLKVNVIRACASVCVCGVGGWGGWQMHGSTVPEAFKLPVIFPMMQRSVHNHGESIVQCCTLRDGPTHRLTGCHNNPDPAPCSLEQDGGGPPPPQHHLSQHLPEESTGFLAKASLLIQVL